MIKFDATTKVVISDNLTSDIWNLLQEENAVTIVMLVDENIAKNEHFIDLKNYLDKKTKLSTSFIKSKEPTTDMVNELTSHFQGDNIDIFIGIGGGSIIDLTKAVSVMAVNDGRVEDYHGTGKEFKAGIKKIMIPTTAGTGSEVTPGAVLLNTNTNFKRAISGRYIIPHYAVLNPNLTLSMPDSIIASTGMDALAHSIESYTAKSANIITKMYSKQAFSLVYNNLLKVFEDRQNISVRQNLLLGSCLAGYAIYNSNTGACHSMAYPLGIYNNIPHGVAVAYLLSKIVKVNIEKGCLLYADLYELIEGVEKKTKQKDKVEIFLSLLEIYTPIKHIDKKFADYGVNESNYEFLAERGLDLTPALSNNPVEFGFADAKRVLNELLR